MSKDFEKLRKSYEHHFITISQLKRWVKLNKKNSHLGITPDEYKLITGQDYE